ncbi:MAG: mechanosensitive ion channel domain-containing protein [Syntrophobacteraceae bacterium]
MKSRHVFGVLCAGVFALMVILTPYSRDAEAVQQDVRVRIGWQITAATQAQIVQVLKRTNVLKSHGLEADFVPFSYGGPQIEAALAGKLDVIFAGDQPAINLVAKGGKWKIVSRLFYDRIAVMVPHSSMIQDIKDLRGKTVAVPFESSAHREVILQQKAAGLDADIEVKNENMDILKIRNHVLLGGGDKWGNIDAVAVWEPIASLFELGGFARTLSSTRTFGVVAVSEDFIAKHPEAAVQFLVSTAQAWEYFSKHSDKVRQWYIDDAQLGYTPEVLLSAAKVDPNFSAKSLGEIDLRLTEDLIATMERDAAWALERGYSKADVHIRQAIDQSLLTMAMNAIVGARLEEIQVVLPSAVHLLKPPDRSSPRAALKTFLDSVDAVGAFLVHDYMPSPSLANLLHLRSLGDISMQGLDMSELPPASRRKAAAAAGLELYETLSRIELPSFDSIPDADPLNPPGSTNPTRWVIPNTEIALVRVTSGPHSGDFLFSTETVAKAEGFYERVRGLPYTRPVPLKNLHEILVRGGGWPIPYAWIQAMPAWLQAPLAGQAVWKWIALALVLVFFILFLRLAYRLSRRGSSQHPVLGALARVTLPAFILLAMPVINVLARIPINLLGGVLSAIELATTAVMFLAGAWLSWRMATLVAEAIIASPRIAPESIDAHLIRIFTRVLGMITAGGFLAIGATQLGIPVYGIIAGLGVGGLAIALAAQPTIENFIGGLSLFADKPIRVGDFCRYGSDEGTVEAIGIRSTGIRGLDRTLTTIPNAALSKMPLVNFALRDRTLIKAVLGIRCETSPEQLRYLLVKIREMLLVHPRVHPDPARVRFVSFGASSLDIELFAYVKTTDREEFFSLREDIFLRVMDIVEQSGTGLAYPSQTLYFTRDGGLHTEKTEEAEAQVRQWRAEGRLPFPNFSTEQMRQMRGTVVYPPPGSPDASNDESERDAQED